MDTPPPRLKLHPPATPNYRRLSPRNQYPNFRLDIPQIPEEPILPKDVPLTQRVTTRTTPPKIFDTIELTVEDLCDTIDNADYSKIDWSTVFVKSQKFHELKIPNETENISLFDISLNRWIHRECPTTFPKERLRYSFIARQLKEELSEVSSKYPEYFYDNEIFPESAEPLKAEMEAWLTEFSDIISAISATSKSSALILQTFKSRLIKLFSMIIPFIRQQKKPEVIEEEDKPEDQDAKDRKISNLQFSVDALRLKCKNLEKDIEGIRKENEDYHIEAVTAKYERSKYEKQLTTMIETSNNLKSSLTEAEHTIYALSQKNHIFKTNGSLGFVPQECLEMWDQMSCLIHLLDNGILSSLNMNEYLPETFAPDYVPPFFSFPRDKIDRSEPMHFSAFFHLMRKSMEEIPAEKTLATAEAGIRHIINEVVKQYVNKFADFKRKQLEIQRRILTDVSTLRNAQRNSYAWISDLLAQGCLIVLPKKTTYNMYDAIRDICARCIEMFKAGSPPISACNVIDTHYKERRDNLLVFIGSIYNGSQSDFAVELFKRFMDQRYSLDEFLLFCVAYVRAYEIEFRDAFLSLFGGFGWQSKRFGDLEEANLNERAHFLVMCLSVYESLIKHLSAKVPNPESDSQLDVLFGVGSEEGYQIRNTISALSQGDGKSTQREIAIIAFWRKQKLGLPEGVLQASSAKILEEYSPEDSSFFADLLEYSTAKSPRKRGGSRRGGSVKKPK